MKLGIERLYRVYIEEKYEGQDLLIENARMLVKAHSVEEACEKIRQYYGMGIEIIITKCEIAE